jgi:hypothetical protein
MSGLKASALFGFLTTAIACSVTQLPPPERLRRSKCSACHIAPAVGSMNKTTLEAALNKHKGRVPLTAEDRAALVKHLVKAQ